MGDSWVIERVVVMSKKRVSRRVENKREEQAHSYTRRQHGLKGRVV